MKLIFLILILLLTRHFSVFSQSFDEQEQREIDSLNAILATPNSHDTTLAEAYLQLSGRLFIANLDTMIPLCEKSIEIAKRQLAKDPSEAVRLRLLKTTSSALNNIGYVYYKKGDVQIGVNYILENLKVKEKLGDKEGIAAALNNIGYIYNDNGDIEKTLEFYHRSLELYEELDNKEGVATTLNNIGYVYSRQDDYEKAIEYLGKSLKLLEETNNMRGMVSCLNNMGSIHDEQGDHIKSLEHFEHSLKIANDIGFKDGAASSLTHIGYQYYTNGELDKALKSYQQGLLIRKEIADKDGISTSLVKISQTIFKQGDIKLAKSYANQGLQLSRELGYPLNIQLSANVLSRIYEAENDGMKALKMHKLYIRMRDSLHNDATEKSMVKQQAKYAYDKQKIVDDAKHDKQLALGIEEKKKQQIVIYATVGGLALLAIFLAFIYNRLKITRRQKDEIKKQQQELEITHSELAQRHTEIADSISYAQQLQQAIFPSREELNKDLRDGFILFEPKDVVSGDFYWLEKVKDQVLFAVADCTGHGVPGAMVSVVCSNALDQAVKEYEITDTGKILDKVTDLVIKRFEKSGRDISDGMDIGLCSLNWETKMLQFSGANNPLWIIRKRDNKFEPGEKDVYNDLHYLIEHKGMKQPVGKQRNRVPFNATTVQLIEGDIIYVFSDGFADQFGGVKGKKFKYKPYKKLLLSLVNESMNEQKNRIFTEFNDWKGDLEQIDDICIIGIRI